MTPVEENEKKENTRTELPEELLVSFARFLSDEIKGFYRSDRGKDFYAEWLKRHPEYAEKEALPG